MCYDNRYPHMYPVESGLPGVDPGVARAVRRTAREIGSRTGLRAFYNRKLQNVLYTYHSEPSGGPIALEVRGYSGAEIDVVVEYAQSGKIPPREKERIAARNRQLEKWAREDQTESHLAERRPDALSYAGFLDRKRRGTATTVAVL